MTLTVDDQATVSDMKAVLAKVLPALEPALPTALTAINQEFAFPSDTIPPGAEVALFPPVSGGAGVEEESGSSRPIVARVTGSAVDLEELFSLITLPTTGAICLFTGTVRAYTVVSDSHNHQHCTDYLQYEAYVPMAETKMRQVATEIQQKWPNIEGVAVVQRVGKIYPGTLTVMIACSASHRDTGVFEASRYGIDRLKEIVPVWKKEYSADGAEWLEGSYEPREQDRFDGE